MDAVRIACPGCGAPVERIKDVGNPWLDAGIVPFSTLHFREDPDYWAKWFPADFITESFPGQFRNWFYSMLAMSTVLRREPPFQTIFGYALVFGEDGRPMHKSWGNAIEFDEAAERMGVDVMRWMFAKARPEDNILFGWHAADEARRELLVLWNVYAFFVTYARLAGWTPAEAAPPRRRTRRPRPLDPVARGRAPRRSPRTACATTDAVGATRAISTFMDDLSTWYLRLLAPSGSRATRTRADQRRRVRDAARGARSRPSGCWRRSCRSSPTRCTATWSTGVRRGAGQRPPDAPARPAELRDARDARSRRRMARGPRGRRPRPDAAQLGRHQDPPAAGPRLARAPGPRAARRCRSSSALIATEINVKVVEVIADDSDLVERRVKPLLPKIGKRLGAAIPAVMAAARDGRLHDRPGRVGHPGRGDARGGRGGDPGVAATGHRRRRA